MTNRELDVYINNKRSNTLWIELENINKMYIINEDETYTINDNETKYKNHISVVLFEKKKER